MRGGALLAVVALVACGGSGSSLAPAGAARSPSAALSIRIIVPGQPTHSPSSRRPRFVSPAALGASVTLSGSTTVAAAFDLSPGSPLCTGSVNRTCTGLIGGIPAGSYQLTAYTYDAAPVGGAIPAGAHQLGLASAPQTVTAGTPNVASLYVSGFIAAYGSPPPAFISLPADGATHSVLFALDPLDFAAAPITAGANDPFANPIVASLTESGGSGIVTLVLNGVSVGTSATVSHSTDMLTLAYDAAASVAGEGVTGYSATVTFRAAYAGSVPVTTAAPAAQSVTVAPLYVTPAAYFAANRINFTSAGLTSTLAISEANVPNGTNVQYTATPNASCAGVATAGAPAAGATSSSTLTAGSTARLEGCTILVSDNIGTVSSVPINVANANISVARLPAANAHVNALTDGPDGNVWAVDYISGYGYIDKIIPASPSSPVQITPNSSTFHPEFITTGPNGKLWLTEASGQLYTINPMTNAIAVAANLQSSSSGNTCGIVPSGDGNQRNLCGIVTGSDGNLYVAGQNRPASNPAIYRVTTGGVKTAFGTAAAVAMHGGVVLNSLNNGSKPFELATSSLDGNVWFTEFSSSIGRLNVSSGALTEYDIGNRSASITTYGITAAPDGSLYVTTFNGNEVVHIVPAADGVAAPTILRLANPNAANDSLGGVPGVGVAGTSVAANTSVDGTTVSFPSDITYVGGTVWIEMTRGIGRLRPVGGSFANGSSFDSAITGGEAKTTPLVTGWGTYGNTGLIVGPDGELWYGDGNPGNVYGQPNLLFGPYISKIMPF